MRWRYRHCLTDSLIVRYGLPKNIPTDPNAFPYRQSIKHLTFRYGPHGSFTNSLEPLGAVFASTVETLRYESTPSVISFRRIESANHEPFNHDPLGNGDRDWPILFSNVSFLSVFPWRSEGTFPHLKDTFQCLNLPALERLYILGDCDFNSSFSQVMVALDNMDQVVEF